MDGKRDIVEVAEELGIELTFHEGYENPYYTAFCPLHDNTKTPAFAIYPAVQRFYCYACTPEGGDVIDLIMRKEGITFKQAVKKVCYELTPEDTLLKALEKNQHTPDMHFLQMRACKLNDTPRRLNFQTAQRILKRFDTLMSKGRWVEADQLLRTAGV